MATNEHGGCSQLPVSQALGLWLLGAVEVLHLKFGNMVASYVAMAGDAAGHTASA